MRKRNASKEVHLAGVYGPSHTTWPDIIEEARRGVTYGGDADR